ncbi:MAG: glycosyltransferase [Hespellia sp.]|nr:glycosyltransferase [Hespellia sp.]
MLIVFVSNFLNHHQLPLCQAFINTDGIEFYFVATERIPQSRLDMKYEDMNCCYPFVVRAYEENETFVKAKKLAIDADVVIIGSAPNEFIEERLKKYDKMTFRFCERSLRKGTWRRFIPKTRNRINREYIQYNKNRLFILGASSYTSSDIALCGFPPEKCFRWGYFPNVIKYKETESIFQNKTCNSIIWVGRFIKCKHPEAALNIARKLVKNGIHFKLQMVGDGPLKCKLKRDIERHGLRDYIELTGSVTPDEVRERMLNAEVFLFTSDFYEGWGAVVNEAMNSMCVPVISHACGSAAFLIAQEENGFVYKYGNEKEASQQISRIFEDRRLREDLSKRAYCTMESMWNAETAVERFLVLTQKLSEGRKASYEIGPCSVAPVIRNNWYKGV